MKAVWIYGIASLIAMSTAVAQADPGYFASVEGLLLTPKINSTGFQKVFYDGVDFDNVETDGSYSDDLQGAVRFIFGKEGCDGFGVQFRYFSFDNEVNYDGLWDAGAGTIQVIGNNEIDVDAFDAEVTQRGKFRNWDFILSGGLRYGGVEISQNNNLFGGIPAVVFGGRTGVEFDGVGPTFSLSADRPIGHGMSIIGRARTALLFGDIDVTPGFRNGGTFTIQDEFVQVTELQFGLGYDRCVYGRDLSLSVLWEAQRWDSDSGFLGDLALHGLALTAGINY